MILRQYLHTEPVAASYLFGCGGKAAGAVVDPVGDISVYLDAAEKTGLRIRFVADTHLHADHVSAGRALAEAAGAEYVLFTGAEANFPFRGVDDGDILELGNVTMTVMHTPGYTPEHVSFLVTDRTRSSEPWFIGHTLMVGDLSRTELATTAEDGAWSLMADAGTLRKQVEGPDGYYNLERMLKGVITRTGKVLLCGTCMDERGLAESELAEGVRRSSMAELAEATAAADKVLVL